MMPPEKYMVNRQRPMSSLPALKSGRLSGYAQQMVTTSAMAVPSVMYSRELA